MQKTSSSLLFTMVFAFPYNVYSYDKWYSLVVSIVWDYQYKSLLATTQTSFFHREFNFNIDIPKKWHILACSTNHT